MAKEFAKKFYKSKAWKQCRESYIALRVSLDGGMCERCKKELGYIVHHKEELTPLNINNPDVTLNHTKLEYVCKKCHDNEHDFGRGKKTFVREGLKFDDNGQLIPVSPP